jgi:hypothetical protein
MDNKIFADTTGDMSVEARAATAAVLPPWMRRFWAADRRSAVARPARSGGPVDLLMGSDDQLRCVLDDYDEPAVPELQRPRVLSRARFESPV